MAHEFTLVCRFEHEPDIERTVELVERALECEVIDWDLEEV